MDLKPVTGAPRSSGPASYGRSLTSRDVTTPIHLQATAPLAERVLLPGDPGRALLLAQALLEGPKMFNHNRGLWGYTGTARDGALLTIQSTGMGGPSAAIVIAELAMLGAQQLIRVGTCGALEPSLQLGDLLIATEAITADGASRVLSDAPRVAADPGLLAALTNVGAGASVSGVVASTDLFYDGPGEQSWIDAGALAVEMETATLFALAARRGLQAAAVLIVSDLLFPKRKRIDSDGLREAEQRMGELAVSALRLTPSAG
jgi:DeoD family purine-nucleoside phosphorylase